MTSLPFKLDVGLPPILTVRFGREALTAPDGRAWSKQKPWPCWDRGHGVRT